MSEERWKCWALSVSGRRERSSGGWRMPEFMLIYVAVVVDVGTLVGPW